MGFVSLLYCHIVEMIFVGGALVTTCSSGNLRIRRKAFECSYTHSYGCTYKSRKLKKLIKVGNSPNALLT